MNKSKRNSSGRPTASPLNGSGADASDYNFWRSQHRASEDDDAQQKSLEKVWQEAVFNRLGEEMGRRLDDLVWPEVPERWKSSAAVFFGRLIPVISAGKKVKNGLASIRQSYRKHEQDRFFEAIENLEHPYPSASEVHRAAIKLRFTKMAMKEMYVDAVDRASSVGKGDDAAVIHRELQRVFINQLACELRFDEEELLLAEDQQAFNYAMLRLAQIVHYSNRTLSEVRI